MDNKIIFWDWNGTLLNDIDACVDSMNDILEGNKKNKIDAEYYKQVFGFPVFDYYKKLGFRLDNDDFESLSHQFIEGYNKRIDSTSLHDNALEVLNHYRDQGRTQVVISAMEQTMLKDMLEQTGISHYFEEVKGLSDIYANGKTHLAEDYIEANNVKAEDVLFIGDTLHDAEVAAHIGCDLVLVANGHHSYERLAVNGNRVVSDLSKLILT